MVTSGSEDFSAVRRTRQSARIASAEESKAERGSPSSTRDGDPDYDSCVQNSNGAIKSFGNSIKKTVRSSNRLVAKPTLSLSDAVKHSSTPITAEERAEWKGWVEIESDPAFFNAILGDLGVEGVKVQELFALDQAMIDNLPKPIYGLIFLFQIVDDESETQEQECPEDVWFANQTINNACATISLLNLVMNIPDVDIGPILWSLKDFSRDMTPFIRGYTVGNHEFIRRVHNSFARKMDILNADLGMSNEYEDGNKKKKKTTRRVNKKGNDDVAFHFSAFVPIGGNIWKLDGLDSQPTKIGRYDVDWMDIVRPLIQDQMTLHTELGHLNFTLLSLCRSPLLSIPEELAVSIKTLISVEGRLDEVQDDWNMFMQNCGEKTLSGPDTILGVTQIMIDTAEMTVEISEKLREPSIGVEQLLALHGEVVEVQNALRRQILEEMIAVDDDNQRAASRRHDYTPMIQTWLQALAETGVLEDICEDVGTS